MTAPETSSVETTRPLEASSDPFTITPAASRVGGRYVLLKRLGAGGSGEVYSAFDPVLDRRVALKLLLESRAEPTLIREGRILAKLVHPAVVTVHDLGIDAGRAYLAMELLEGEDILAFAERARARDDAGEILDAVTTVGRGLAAAHRAGIVHGDIKPSNLLRGTDGRTKLSDFGIAQLVGTSVTDTSDRIAGTPAYLAPEQHLGAGASEKADQYALCLTAWVLFHGRHPFARDSESQRGTNSIGWDDTAEAGRQESATPVALQSLARAQTAWTPRFTAAGLSPRLVEALQRGLRLDPAERWPDIESLLLALKAPQRHGRRRAAIAGAVAISGAATWMMFGSETDPCQDAGLAVHDTWNPEQADRLRRAWDFAADDPQWGPTLGSITASLDAYTEAWNAASRENCRATHVQRTQSDEMLDVRARCLGRARGSLSEAVDVLMTQDPAVWLNAHDVVGALPDLDRCSDPDALLDERPLPDDPERAARVEAARQIVQRSVFELRAGAPEAARESLGRVAAELDELGFGPLSAEYWSTVAEVDLWAVDYESATRHGRIALQHALRFDQFGEAIDASGIVALARARAGAFEDAVHFVDIALALSERDDSGDSERGFAHAAATELFLESGELQRAERHARQSLRFLEEADGPMDPGVATARGVLGLVLHQQGRLDEAREQYERALKIREAVLGSWHQQIAQGHHNLSLIYADMDDPRAEEHSRRALEIATAVFGPVDPRVAQVHDALGSILKQRGRKAEALEHLEASLAAFGDRAESVVATHARVNYAQLLDELGRTGEAETELRRALAIQQESLGDEHLEVARTQLAIGALASGLDRYDEARAAFEAAEAIFVAQGHPTHPNRLRGMIGLAQVERNTGHDDRARALLEDAAALLESSGQPGTDLRTLIDDDLAEIHLAAQRPVEAAAYWVAALQAERSSTSNPGHLARFTFGLARSTWAQGDRDGARAWAKEAAEHASRIEGPAGEVWRTRIDTWRSEHDAR